MLETTIGKVPSGTDNRYWQFPLMRKQEVGKSSWLNRLLLQLYWIACTCLIFKYSVVLFVGLRIRYGKIKLEPYAKKVVDCLPNFIDIYPTSVYPLVIKSFELAYYKKYKLAEPSLELATGDGFFTSKLYKGKKEKLTIASDMMGETLLQASKYKFWRKMAIIDASQVPLPDDSLNTVIMNNLIHHLPDRKETLKEMHRILRNGGTFIFTDELLNWATSQWHVRFRDGYAYRQHLDEFLKQTVQCLLADKLFWLNAIGSDWELCEMTTFFSSRAMFWCSILETLNRKMGAPTPKPIRDILGRVPLIKKWQMSMTKRIAEYFIAVDAEWCMKYGATSLFVALRKKRNADPMDDLFFMNEPIFVCPTCNRKLNSTCGFLICSSCSEEYPYFKGIPFLVSYASELPVEYYEKASKQVSKIKVSC